MLIAFGYDLTAQPNPESVHCSKMQIRWTKNFSYLILEIHPPVFHFIVQE